MNLANKTKQKLGKTNQMVPGKIEKGGAERERERNFLLDEPLSSMPIQYMIYPCLSLSSLLNFRPTIHPSGILYTSTTSCISNLFHSLSSTSANVLSRF